eukprot:CAMPEP_0201281286 /NCGR_PEP_ID=MMETSP1317-20130820/2193_1 /ASSEMBLY_ACC=CAM_ASM_000770 /TAXON_ID=187299 /ORGANISM="Undescribed Undescribed, Strain Undescribed" /LENGTH=31 /DNA_ID= /DNA_START= /DNA_END= /DNA_ORIENTATION=
MHVNSSEHSSKTRSITGKATTTSFQSVRNKG